jgi:lysophospholipase L1-like esterase
MRHEHRIVTKARGAAMYCVFLVFMSFFALVLLEGALRLAAFIRGEGAYPYDPRIRADSYVGSGWHRDGFDELQALRMIWQPYVYWRFQPFDGKYVTVYPNGLRRTDNPKCPETVTPVKIFFFGGSCAWGYGARDGFTIPSCLSRILSRSGEVCMDVANYGQFGYINTQDVIALMGLLQEGRESDVVIFFDGVNDVFAAYQNGSAGVPQSEANRRQEFNVASRKTIPVIKSFCAILLKRSQIYRVIRRSLTGVDEYHEGDWLLGYADLPSDPATSERLALELARVYSANMRMVQSLGSTYGFSPLFYWQPVLYHKNRLTAYETEMAKRVEDARSPFLAVYSGVSESPDVAERPGFHDLSGLFRDVDGPVFLDVCHTSERGNEIIAERIAADVAGLIGKAKAIR